ncbi:MAG: sodium:solute symporter [Bacteroidetes bacterium CG2_30_33_31]|nr:MAG: sodium:solute symporter [Bacteroidetes bacterium CG2_30_33_31]
MSPELIFTTLLIYTSFLFIISYFTSRKANNESFFTGNHVSPWYVVAYGMIGASLSGVTFISVPGAVGNQNFSYLMLVFGYLLGYLIIINVLLPLYYRLKLTSIYTYLRDRFGYYSYKSGASYFLLSRVIGASFRMFLVINVLQTFVFDKWNVPYGITVLLFIGLILLYTFKGGIKTIVWTDTFQTTFMLAAVILSMIFISQQMNIGFTSLFTTITHSSYSDFIDTDWQSPRYFVKQFISGALISIVMTGMDQDMMQKNLSCRNIKEAKKNMFWLSFTLVPINIMFLFLGATLYIFAAHNGITIPSKPDDLFPTIALQHLGAIAGITFILGIIAATFASSDSALAALTTSFSLDILNIEKKDKYTVKQQIRIRKIVHLSVSFLLFLVIMVFKLINRDSVINELFTAAGYTYGPLLGLFAFGVMTKYNIKDNYVIPVVIAAPIISYLLSIYSQQLFNGYKFGFELLLINGLLTFLGLFLITKKDSIKYSEA